MAETSEKKTSDVQVGSQVERDLEQLGAIREIGESVKVAHAEYLASHEETKDRKKLWEALVSDLTNAIDAHNDPQTTFPFSATADPGDWRNTHLRHTGMPAGAINKLAANHIERVGQLAEFFARGSKLQSLEGIGPGVSLTIADAWADYGHDHPEIYD